MCQQFRAILEARVDQASPDDGPDQTSILQVSSKDFEVVLFVETANRDLKGISENENCWRTRRHMWSTFSNLTDTIAGIYCNSKDQSPQGSSKRYHEKG
jgi:hypothetical protein